jgi:hypothetical protein
MRKLEEGGVRVDRLIEEGVVEEGRKIFEGDGRCCQEMQTDARGTD